MLVAKDLVDGDITISSLLLYKWYEKLIINMDNLKKYKKDLIILESD
jgi:hypothetical protein